MSAQCQTDESTIISCRLCGSTLDNLMLDLGMSPLCQNRIYEWQLNHMEPFYPLRVFVCDQCYLVQLQEFVAPSEIFSDYAYFSSYSESWVRHAGRYVEMIVERESLGQQSFVVELASNDGYLLQHFVKRGIPCLGIEPAENVAKVARDNGIPTEARFFGKEAATELESDHGKANLIVGNNVLAHVPDINDFVSGISILLDRTGIVTMEFPHLMRLIEQNQFDTIYHEHFSYISLSTAEEIFARHGMKIFDVEELPTHGGSIRIYACHTDNQNRRVGSNVERLRKTEISCGLRDLEYYDRFSQNVAGTKRQILSFLISARENGKSVAGYGAPGKGNTLLNYCGVRQDLLEYTVDVSPHKQGTYTPGTHIPVYAPDMLRETKPDYVFVLPWNLIDEIAEKNSYISDWGGRFVLPIPSVTVI